MAKKAATKTTEATTKPAETKTTPELKSIATRLDALATEAKGLGEDRVHQMCERAAKSARHAGRQRATRLKRVGGLVSTLKAKGLSDAEIIARLSTGRG